MARAAGQRQRGVFVGEDAYSFYGDVLQVGREQRVPHQPRVRRRLQKGILKRRALLAAHLQPFGVALAAVDLAAAADAFDAQQPKAAHDDEIEIGKAAVFRQRRGRDHLVLLQRGEPLGRRQGLRRGIGKILGLLDALCAGALPHEKEVVQAHQGGDADDEKCKISTFQNKPSK